MTFSQDIKRFGIKVELNTKAIFLNTASHALESIVNGSGVTGAPGQPVDTGNLRNSWQLVFPDQQSAEITTGVEYAQAVEDNVRGVTFRNHGPHSVRLTVLGMSRIIEVETEKVK